MESPRSADLRLPEVEAVFLVVDDGLCAVRADDSNGRVGVVRNREDFVHGGDDVVRAAHIDLQAGGHGSRGVVGHEALDTRLGHGDVERDFAVDRRDRFPVDLVLSVLHREDALGERRHEGEVVVVDRLDLAVRERDGEREFVAARLEAEVGDFIREADDVVPRILRLDVENLDAYVEAFDAVGGLVAVGDAVLDNRTGERIAFIDDAEAAGRDERELARVVVVRAEVGAFAEDEVDARPRDLLVVDVVLDGVEAVVVRLEFVVAHIDDFEDCAFDCAVAAAVHHRPVAVDGRDPRRSRAARRVVGIGRSAERTVDRDAGPVVVHNRQDVVLAGDATAHGAFFLAAGDGGVDTERDLLGGDGLGVDETLADFARERGRKHVHLVGKTRLGGPDEDVLTVRQGVGQAVRREHDVGRLTGNRAGEGERVVHLRLHVGDSADDIDIVVPRILLVDAGEGELERLGDKPVDVLALAVLDELADVAGRDFDGVDILQGGRVDVLDVWPGNEEHLFVVDDARELEVGVGVLRGLLGRLREGEVGDGEEGADGAVGVALVLFEPPRAAEFRRPGESALFRAVEVVDTGLAEGTGDGDYADGRMPDGLDFIGGLESADRAGARIGVERVGLAVGGGGGQDAVEAVGDEAQADAAARRDKTSRGFPDVLGGAVPDFHRQHDRGRTGLRTRPGHLELVVEQSVDAVERVVDVDAVVPRVVLDDAREHDIRDVLVDAERLVVADYRRRGIAGRLVDGTRRRGAFTDDVVAARHDDELVARRFGGVEARAVVEEEVDAGHEQLVEVALASDRIEVVVRDRREDRDARDILADDEGRGDGIGFLVGEGLAELPPAGNRRLPVDGAGLGVASIGVAAERAGDADGGAGADGDGEDLVERRGFALFRDFGAFALLDFDESGGVEAERRARGGVALGLEEALDGRASHFDRNGADGGSILDATFRLEGDEVLAVLDGSAVYFKDGAFRAVEVGELDGIVYLALDVGEGVGDGDGVGRPRILLERLDAHDVERLRDEGVGAVLGGAGTDEASRGLDGVGLDVGAEDELLVGPGDGREVLGGGDDAVALRADRRDRRRGLRVLRVYGLDNDRAVIDDEGGSPDGVREGVCERPGSAGDRRPGLLARLGHEFGDGDAGRAGEGERGALAEGDVADGVALADCAAGVGGEVETEGDGAGVGLASLKDALAGGASRAHRDRAAVAHEVRRKLAGDVEHHGVLAVVAHRERHGHAAGAGRAFALLPRVRERVGRLRVDALDVVDDFDHVVPRIELANLRKRDLENLLVEAIHLLEAVGVAVFVDNRTLRRVAFMDDGVAAGVEVFDFHAVRDEVDAGPGDFGELLGTRDSPVVVDGFRHGEVLDVEHGRGEVLAALHEGDGPHSALGWEPVLDAGFGEGLRGAAA